MTGISPVNNASSSSVQPSSSSLQVDQNQFIELFVAQLNNQDPLAPLDTNQMLTQLSQISSVESLNSIDDRIDGLISSLQQSQMLGASQLVGKDIKVNTNRVELDQSGSVTGEAQIPVAANDVLIRAYDINGVQVASKSLGAHGTGKVTFTLDDISPGQHTITATAVSGDEAYAAGVTLGGRVSGVEATGAGTYLKLANLGTYPLSSVQAISE